MFLLLAFKIKVILIVFAHPRFSWTRNGSHFDVENDPKVLMKPGAGTLVIDISGEKAEAYEGTYQCTAHNEHGTAVSNNIVIRQSSKNLIIHTYIKVFVH